MINKNEDAHRIKFLEEALFGPQDKPEEKKPLHSSQPVQKKDVDDFKNDRSILSAGVGDIKDTGGPSCQLGTRTNNSIWDSTILDKLAGTPSNKEKTIEKRENINQLRDALKQGRINDMVQSLQNTDTRKDAGVRNIGEYTERGAKYNVPTRHMSIFDTDTDFGRVPQKTAGEEVTDEVNTPKEKDDSWKDVRGTKKINNVLDSFFDHITKNDNE